MDNLHNQMAKGGVTEHGLRKGDTITDDMFWANEAVVKDAKGVKHKVDLDKGKRYAKGGNLKSIAKEYEENEEENAHSVNVVLLAKHFGSADDLKEAKEILARHKKEGHLTSENGKKRMELHLKLIAKARKEMAKEGIKFGKGGAIYKGDKVRIADSNKSMVVKDISKGKKGYVEFSGDKGTYLKGDLEKFAKGGKANEKPLSYYKYETKKVRIAWKGKMQPVGMFYSAEEAMKKIKSMASSESEQKEYSIVTPDKTIHLGESYAIRYAKGGKTASPKPKMVRTQFEEEDYEYAKGGKTASPKPKMVRTQFEEEDYEYGNGGLLGGFNYSIGGL